MLYDKESCEDTFADIDSGALALCEECGEHAPSIAFRALDNTAGVEYEYRCPACGSDDVTVYRPEYVTTLNEGE